MRKRSCKVAGATDFRNDKSNWKIRFGRQVYVSILRDSSVVGNCNGEGHKGLGKTSKSIFRILWCTKRPSGMRGSPGGSSYENLESELVKSFLTRIEERSESQSINEE